MSPGKLAVQVAHGSVASAEQARKEKRNWFRDWLLEGQKKVVVSVANEEELRDLDKLADELELPHELIRDKGLTELPEDTATVFAVGPAPNELVDKLTRRLPLL